jgi:hypothetical protein
MKQFRSIIVAELEILADDIDRLPDMPYREQVSELAGQLEEVLRQLKEFENQLPKKG